MDDGELERRLFVSVAAAVVTRPVPDWQRVHLELRRKSVTLQLLHMEYKEQHPDGFQYTWFTEHYRQYAGRLDLVMRQEHVAGQKMFVDLAGQTVPIYDRETEAKIMEAQIFVSALGATKSSAIVMTPVAGLRILMAFLPVKSTKSLWPARCSWRMTRSQRCSQRRY